MATPARNRLPLLALFAANAISMVGNVLTAIAIPWFVLQTTGSATQTGITGFFSILPVIVAGLFGGTLIDRLGYRRTSISADLASGLTVALVPLLYFTVGLQFWQLMILVFLCALLDALATGAALGEAFDRACTDAPGSDPAHLFSTLIARALIVAIIPAP